MDDSFKSWQRAVAENKLEPEQFAVLQRMVNDGEAESIEAAAVNSANFFIGDIPPLKRTRIQPRKGTWIGVAR